MADYYCLLQLASEGSHPGSVVLSLTSATVTQHPGKARPGPVPSQGTLSLQALEVAKADFHIFPGAARAGPSPSEQGIWRT